MHVYTFLSIFTLTSIVECRTWWNTISDFFSNETVNEDATLDIKELAVKYGYVLEEHKVVTEDGYIINVHRIPAEEKRRNGQVVFLMHGLTESSDSWLLQGPEKALAYVLAEEGFDVWMGNARGNKHSTKHANLNSSSAEYWQFTWEEIGTYDLPATVDYILEKTGIPSLYYVGHSQGTTSGYVFLSMKPEYNAKIKLMFSLAPEAWMGNVRSPIIRMFAPATNEIWPFLDYSLFSSGTDSFNKMSSFMCNWLPLNCNNILFALAGPDKKVNDTLWPVIFGHMPTGSSTLQFVHYGQLVNSKRFCRFDHGAEKNKFSYGQVEPPDYDLGNINVPIVLYYSSEDWVSDPRDVETLRNSLPNVLDSVYLSDFGHMDYVYGSDARDTIYMRIIAQMYEFETNIKKNQDASNITPTAVTNINKD